MAQTIPKIVKTAERLMADIEIAAAHFPRAHRYTLGSDLRRQAMEVTRRAHKAWRDRSDQIMRIGELSDSIDDLKLRLQLGQQVHAFASFEQFEAIARIAAELGRQCGGWHKQRSALGQNAQAKSSSGQRPSILSSHVASPKAIP